MQHIVYLFNFKVMNAGSLSLGWVFDEDRHVAGQILTIWHARCLASSLFAQLLGGQCML